LREAD